MTGTDLPFLTQTQQFIPETYAAYRPLIAEALRFFVDRLSAERRAEIVRAQCALPTDATPSARLVALMHCCPVLHKLGQVVARHRGLDAELRRALQELETFAPVYPFEEIRRIIDEELRRASIQEDVLIAQGAMAEASVAVVVPITWHRTPSGPPQRGVLKVKKPGIEDRLQEELAVLAELADHLDATREARELPPFDYRDTFDTVRDLVAGEVDLCQEQRNLTEALPRYSHRRDVWVPVLLPLSTPRMTAMEYIAGAKVTQVADRPAADRRRLARTIVDALIGDVVFCRDGETVFHADPHAGNLLSPDEMPAGSLAILDWSLTGRMAKRDHEAVARIFLAALLSDAASMASSIEQLSLSTPNEAGLRSSVEEALRGLRRGRLPGPAWLVELLDAAARCGARFSGSMLLFRKALLTVEGVVADVCEDTTLDALLVSKGLETLWSEWPRRVLSWPGSRDFATHVSNSELMGLFAAAPLAMGAAWLHAWHDWFRPAATA